MRCTDNARPCATTSLVQHVWPCLRTTGTLRLASMSYHMLHDATAEPYPLNVARHTSMAIGFMESLIPHKTANLAGAISRRVANVLVNARTTSGLPTPYGLEPKCGPICCCSIATTPFMHARLYKLESNTRRTSGVSLRHTHNVSWCQYLSDGVCVCVSACVCACVGCARRARVAS